MRLIVLAFVAFCNQERGLMMTQESCLHWVKDCFVQLRPAYKDDYKPANRCLNIYDEIFTNKIKDPILD